MKVRNHREARVLLACGPGPWMPAVERAAATARDVEALGLVELGGDGRYALTPAGRAELAAYVAALAKARKR